MSHTNNLHTVTEAWVDSSATVNPAPGLSHKDREARETAAGCRQRASADLLHALQMGTMNGRQVYEKSAASWTKRAELLQRIETGIEDRNSAPLMAAPELTEAEVAEDLAFSEL